MRLVVRLERVLDGDVDAPLAAAERLGGGTRLRAEVLRVRHHRFGAKEVRARHVAVAVSARGVAEGHARIVLVGAVDFDFRRLR